MRVRRERVHGRHIVKSRLIGVFARQVAIYRPLFTPIAISFVGVVREASGNRWMCTEVSSSRGHSAYVVCL